MSSDDDSDYLKEEDDEEEEEDTEYLEEEEELEFFVQNFQLEPGWVVEHDGKKWLVVSINPLQENGSGNYKMTFYWGDNNLPLTSKIDDNAEINVWLTQKVTPVVGNLEDGKLYLQKWDDGWWPVTYNDNETQVEGYDAEKVNEKDEFAEFIVYKKGDKIMYWDVKADENKVVNIESVNGEGDYVCGKNIVKKDSRIMLYDVRDIFGRNVLSINEALQISPDEESQEANSAWGKIRGYIDSHYPDDGNIDLKLVGLENKDRKLVQLPYCMSVLKPEATTARGNSASGATKVFYNRAKELSFSPEITNIYVKDQKASVIFNLKYKPVVLGDDEVFRSVNDLKQSLCNDFMNVWKFADRLRVETVKKILQRLNIYNSLFPVIYEKQEYRTLYDLKKFILEEGKRRNVVAGQKYVGKSFLDWDKLELSRFNEESIIYKKEFLKEYPNESGGGESKDNEDTVSDFYKNGDVYHVLFEEDSKKKITFVSKEGQKKTLSFNVDDSESPVENSVTSEEAASAASLENDFPKFCEVPESECWKLEQDKIPVYYDENKIANEFESWMEVRDVLFQRDDVIDEFNEFTRLIKNTEMIKKTAFTWLKENKEMFQTNYDLNSSYIDMDSFEPSTFNTQNGVIAKRDGVQFKTWYDFAMDVIAYNKFRVSVGGKTLLPKEEVTWNENYNVPESYEGWTAIVVKDGNNARLKFKKGSSEVENFDIVVQSIFESSFLIEDNTEIVGELDDDEVIEDDVEEEEEDEEFKIIIRGELRKLLKKSSFTGKPKTDKFGKWMFSKNEIETLIEEKIAETNKNKALKLVEKQFKNNDDLYLKQLDDLDLLHRITLDTKENHPEVYNIIKQGMQYAWPCAKIIYDM